MGAHPYMEATLVQERRFHPNSSGPRAQVQAFGTTSSQVFPDPNRDMVGRLTHHARSSIRCAFVTFATALFAATRGGWHRCEGGRISSLPSSWTRRRRGRDPALSALRPLGPGRLTPARMTDWVGSSPPTQREARRSGTLFRRGPGTGSRVSLRSPGMTSERWWARHRRSRASRVRGACSRPGTRSRIGAARRPG